MASRNRRSVAIIGGGIMGLATAAALAEDGVEVTLMERDRIAGPHGGSHGRARIIRLTYDNPIYTRLAKSAFAMWDQIGTQYGKSLYRTTGSLDIMLREGGTFDTYRAALDETGVSYDLYTSADIAAQFPQITLPPDARALYQAQSAVLHADLCVDALQTRAIRLGVQIRVGCEVAAIIPNPKGLDIRTTDGPIEAGSVVLVAGRATRALAASLGADLALEVSRKQISFFEPANRPAHTAGSIPLLIFHLGNGVLSSVFPILRDDPVKLMIENNGRYDLPAEDMNALMAGQIRALIQPHLPNLTGSAKQTDTCHYVLAPNGDFVIDRLPNDPRIVICSACSGHGFKFAPVIGREVARLIADPQAQPYPQFGIGRVAGPVARAP